MSRLRCRYHGEYDPDTVHALCGELSLKPLTAHALMRRGVHSTDEAQRFLHPEEQPLFDPHAMPQMQMAVDRLRKAFTEDETICIYGDYDADGICAVAILMDCFSIYSEQLIPYIPARHGEGYGLHEEAVRKLYEQGVSLIVTVDNGISAADEIALCASLGMDVIVTDHHSRPERLPDCVAVITPDDGACGAGVALRLARALYGDGRLERWLPMAALATVADVVPLVGDNRTVVARGIPYVEDNLGLNALLRAAGNGGNAVDAGTLAFLLAPRLNAAGRLGDAMRGVSLLLAEDQYTADRLAAELNGANTERRAIESEILLQAERMLSCETVRPMRAVVLKSEGWNVGVIGIVASRLSEKYHCPTLLFSENEEGILTGSGRSAGHIDLYEALSACAGHFMRYGGHKGAAGVTMSTDSFEAFCTDFRSFLCARYSDADFEPSTEYDEAIPLSALTLSSVSELRRLAPFGEGNPEPVYRMDGLRLTELKSMGQDGRHISARAIDGNAALRLVGFGFGDRLPEFKSEAEWTVLARPGVNSFRGTESVELVLTAAEPGRKLFDDFFRKVLYNELCVEDCEFFRTCAASGAATDSASMRQAYAILRERIGVDGCRVEELDARIDMGLKCALAVFCELGFYTCDGAAIRLDPDAPKRELTESRLYRQAISNDKREESSWT